MEVELKLYGQLYKHLKSGNVNLGDELTVALMADTYSFDFTHELFTEIDADEVDDTTYTDYSQQIMTGNDVTYDGVNAPRQVLVDGDDVNFGNEVTITARYAIIFASGANHNQELIAAVDFLEERSSVDGVFEIRWHDDGIFLTEVPE